MSRHKSRRIGSSEYYAIRRTIEFGRQIQREFPRLAEDFAEKNAREIVKMYDLARYGAIKERMAISSVYYALEGFDGGWGIKPYKGLLNEDRVAELASKHHKKSTSKNIRKLKKEKRGIFGLSLEDRIKAGKDSATEMGLEIWSGSEENDLYAFSQLPEYQVIRANIKLITKALNRKYHRKRSESAVEQRLSKLRKANQLRATS